MVNMSKVQRINEYPLHVQYAIKMLYERINKIPKDGKWRHFEGIMQLRDEKFSVTCNFRFEGDFLKLNDMKVDKARDNIVYGSIVKVD